MMDDRQIMNLVDSIRHAIRPPQWEYDSIPYGNEGNFATLNDRGLNGWEAVGLTTDPQGHTTVLLKRPLQNVKAQSVKEE